MCFLFNESFKLYTALCQEKGINYFVGQHGNNYGTSRFPVANIEESTPNFFLTWGWQNQIKSYLPAYIFKVAGVKIKHDKNGELLLLEYPYGDRSSTWDSDREHQIYFDDLLLFISLLGKEPLDFLKVRLRYESSVDSFNSKQKLKDFMPQIRTEYWDVPILQQYEKTRLAVFSYDSTGMLESLALNIPTMAFWQNGLDHLNDSAKSYYKCLIDAGIVHLSSESIAKSINTVWDDVDSWWSQDSIQFARKTFCDQYARTSKKPLRDLRNLLKENINERK
jgi:putative transferase (TIGR04331 family)